MDCGRLSAIAHCLQIHDKSTFMLVCRSSAKINLTLEVLSRRADGYHLLRSVVHSIGLWDTLYFEFGIGPGFSLRSNWPALMTEDNLCLRAAKAWTEAASGKTPQRFGGVRITLNKTIPLGGGLGGGSSNAAATLLALNSQYQNLLDKDELQTIALQLGADVPFFLQGGCALMEGIGEKLTSLPAQKAWAVLICPPFHANTSKVFQAFDEMPRTEKSAPTSDELRKALETRQLKSIGPLLQNDLIKVSSNNLFDPARAIKVLLAHDAMGATMSGSGSTVFGLFKGKMQAQDARSKIAEVLNEDFMVYAVPLTGECFALLPPTSKRTK
jgi:4-diphosphocytidyl-2-C-methyl-D-erythritol kinase